MEFREHAFSETTRKYRDHGYSLRHIGLPTHLKSNRAFFYNNAIYIIDKCFLNIVQEFKNFHDCTKFHPTLQYAYV
jgi:hypothetical protein